MMHISKKTIKLLAMLAAIGAVAGAWAIWYVFFKPHRNVGDEKPAYALQADALRTAFTENSNAVATYIDKAVLIEGTVTETDSKFIALGNIICNFEDAHQNQLPNIKKGDKIKIQGRISTYNDLMDEIVMDKCVVK